MEWMDWRVIKYDLRCMSYTFLPHPNSLSSSSFPGSYRYMAPEVFRHEPYNSRVDVYSFSMILYQLLEVLRVDEESGMQAAVID